MLPMPPFPKSDSVFYFVKIFAIYISTCLNLSAQEILPIHADWQFSKARVENWYPATVPGTVHQDLLANGLIDDPYVFDNELKQYWIEHTDWVYKTTFDVSAAQLQSSGIELVFDGLDTYSEIRLNGQHIANTNNMFVQYTFDVKSLLRQGKNTLEVYFHAPTKINTWKAERHPFTVPAVNEYARPKQRYSVYSRKAPYHFGWDWGPRIVTSGIWRSCYLKCINQAQLHSVYYDLQKLDKKRAMYSAKVELNILESGVYDIEFLINNATVAKKAGSFQKGNTEVEVNFFIQNPKLWWSAGLGEPYLYETKCILRKSGKAISEIKQNLGVRTVEVIQEKDTNPGLTFKIRLNGVDVFMKGSNYIPPDNLNPRVTNQHYDKIIKATVDAHMNMLRVWGGAVYEDPYFYEACDRNGVLIWQDFMFACAMTPGDSEHLQNLKAEFTYNVKRLRNHACVALWCGNNENMEQWFTRSWRAKYGVNTQDSIALMKTYQEVFYNMIPKILKKYDAKRYYWPSSPAGAYEISQANSYAGDVHNWWIWFGGASFQDIARDKKRFVSEYGLQSYPELKTLMHFARPQDTTFDAYIYDLRQRSELTWNATASGANLSKGNEMIQKYVDMYFKSPSNFRHFIYLTQIMQGEGLKQITEGHRAAKPYCWGSLYWQIDDCWPTISWSTIDYFYRWKASHYLIKAANKPLIVTPIEANGSNVISIVGVNDLNQASRGVLKVWVKDFNGMIKDTYTANVSLKPLATKTLYTMDGWVLKQKYDTSTTFIHMQYVDQNNQTYNNTYYLTRPKYLSLSKNNPDVAIIESDNRKYIKLKSTELCRWVHLSVPDDQGYFSDNAFDLVPGVDKEIEYTGALSVDELRKVLKINHLALTYL